jgi:hypothetical protein
MNTDDRWIWDSVWPAPAKLNLFLHVVGRRADGYHLLQTVFRFIGRGDSLHFSPRTDGRVMLARPLPGVLPESNLAVRAACLLQEKTGCRQGVRIGIEKRRRERRPLSAGRLHRRSSRRGRLRLVEDHEQVLRGRDRSNAIPLPGRLSHLNLCGLCGLDFAEYTVWNFRFLHLYR